MASPNRYPSTPLGESLGRFYKHRSVLRRTIPLITITAKDLAKALKGEMAESGELSATGSSNTPHQRTAVHHRHRHAHASS
ncbi:MAG: hypothetical protein WBF69_02710 [Castellaniella sp.]|uniref:hypothetical protein n=1 Tax=Castellaniella sp. TaxID=1955812 RepID=UPI003C77D6EB